MVLTVQYNAELYSKKISLTDYYGNLIFYNFKSDTQTKLFENDTFIKPFRNPNYYYSNNPQFQSVLPKNFTSKYLLLLVYEIDFNQDKMIDEADPAYLFACHLDGTNLKRVTPVDENAESFEVFDNEGFILVRMQRDFNGDKKFTYKDKDFYYLKIDFSTLEIVGKIEM